jgi:SOS-response transcriptional repressor LexA
MQPKTRARVAELLVMSLEARLRGRIQDWSLAPDEWQGVSNPGSKTKLKSSTERTALRKLTRRLKLPSTGCRKDHVFGESSVLIFDGRIRTRTMPLVGEVMSNGEVKKFQGSQKAKVPEVFYQDKRTNYSLLRLRGNFFAGNEIGDGTLLIYEARKNARNGQLAVAMIEGKTMVTWFERDEHRIRLQSLNGNQASLNVEGEQKVQIVGVVVGLVRPAA